MGDLWIVTYAETIDDDRIAAAAFKAESLEGALVAASVYFADWGFSAPEVMATHIPTGFTDPIYISIGRK